MMKKTTQTLLLVFSSLLLLISVTVSASAQGIIRGQIRWKKDYGVVPMGPGNSQAAVYPCSPFFVAALDTSNNNKPVTYTDGLLQQGADQGDYYVCNYTMRVPANKSLYIIAGMGGVLLLPKMDRSPYLITGTWIGGSRSKPPAGYERGFTGYQYVTIRGTSKRPRIVNFEMLYVGNDDPK